MELQVPSSSSVSRSERAGGGAGSVEASLGGMFSPEERMSCGRAVRVLVGRNGMREDEGRTVVVGKRTCCRHAALESSVVRGESMPFCLISHSAVRSGCVGVMACRVAWCCVVAILRRPWARRGEVEEQCEKCCSAAGTTTQAGAPRDGDREESRDFAARGGWDVMRCDASDGRR